MDGQRSVSTPTRKFFDNGMYQTTNSEYGSYSRPSSSINTPSSYRGRTPQSPYRQSTPQRIQNPPKQLPTINQSPPKLSNPPSEYVSPPQVQIQQEEKEQEQEQESVLISAKERAAIVSIITENKTLRQENEELKTMIVALKQAVKNYRQKYGDLD